MKLGDGLPVAVHESKSINVLVLYTQRYRRDKAAVSTRGIVAFITILQKMAKNTLIQCVRLEGS